MSEEKKTRRLMRPNRDPVGRVREKYQRRRKAIEHFTDRISKTHGWISPREVEKLRDLGVSLQEIEGLIEAFALKDA